MFGKKWLKISVTTTVHLRWIKTILNWQEHIFVLKGCQKKNPQNSFFFPWDNSTGNAVSYLYILCWVKTRFCVNIASKINPTTSLRHNCCLLCIVKKGCNCNWICFNEICKILKSFWVINPSGTKDDFCRSKIAKIPIPRL